jgi:hypothetical protein
MELKGEVAVTHNQPITMPQLKYSTKKQLFVNNTAKIYLKKKVLHGTKLNARK